MWSFHLGDLMNNAEEKEGEVLSYPIATVFCLCLWMSWEVSKESQFGSTLGKKNSFMWCFSVYELSLCFMNFLSVHLFAHQLSRVNKKDISKQPREIIVNIFVISYSCICLLASSLPMDENSPFWILVVKKWEVKQFSFNLWSACALSGCRWMGLETEL